MQSARNFTSGYESPSLLESSPPLLDKQKERTPTWQEKNGCQLMLSDTDQFRDLDITNAAYVRYHEELYYFNKKTNELRLLKLTENELSRFDTELQVLANNNRRLSDEELNLIESLTGHLHRTRLQKFLAGFGYFCSALMAVGCGVSTAGTFIALGLTTGGLAWVLAGTLFLASTAVNWWIFKRYVSSVLIDFFGKENFFVDEEGKPLSPLKKWAMGGALVLSLCVGATFAALTYSSTFTLSVGLPFLAVIAPAFPYIAAVLLGVTLVSMTALMLKDIATLIKKNDVLGECKKFLKDLVNTDPELPQNRGKSRGRILGERITTVTLTALFLPLACLGLYMTMKACVPGLQAILLETMPRLPVLTAGAIATTVSLGFAFVGQIPFGIQTAFQTVANIVPAAFQGVAKLFKRDQGENAQPDQRAVTPSERESTAALAWKTVKLIGVGINAIGNGLISMIGATGSSVVRYVAFMSGMANSAFAGIPAVLNSSVPKRSYDDIDLALRRERPSSSPTRSPQPSPNNSIVLDKPQPSPRSSNLSGSPVSLGRNSSAFYSNKNESKEEPRPLTYAKDDISISYSPRS